jgi:hypothetical protein
MQLSHSSAMNAIHERKDNLYVIKNKKPEETNQSFILTVCFMTLPAEVFILSSRWLPSSDDNNPVHFLSPFV